MKTLLPMLCIVLSLAAIPAHAVVWRLEDTPAKHRPKLCEDLRQALTYELGTQSYKRALKRKAEGNLWRIHKARLARVAELRGMMRQLSCSRIP